MPQERLPKQALHAKANGENKPNDLELVGPLTLRILDGIAWTSPKRNDGGDGRP